MLAFLIKTLPTIWPFIQELLQGSRDRPNQKRRSSDRRVNPWIWILIAIVLLGGEHITTLNKEIENYKTKLVNANTALLNEKYETKLCLHDADRLQHDIQEGKEVIQNQKLECDEKIAILQRKMDQKAAKEGTAPRHSQSERIQKKLDMLDHKT